MIREYYDPSARHSITCADVHTTSPKLDLLSLGDRVNCTRGSCAEVWLAI
jgi:hypothetical protein